MSWNALRQSPTTAFFSARCAARRSVFWNPCALCSWVMDELPRLRRRRFIVHLSIDEWSWSMRCGYRPCETYSFAFVDRVAGLDANVVQPADGPVAIKGRRLRRRGACRPRAESCCPPLSLAHTGFGEGRAHSEPRPRRRQDNRDELLACDGRSLEEGRLVDARRAPGPHVRVEQVKHTGADVERIGPQAVHDECRRHVRRWHEALFDVGVPERGGHQIDRDLLVGREGVLAAGGRQRTRTGGDQSDHDPLRTNEV